MKKEYAVQYYNGYDVKIDTDLITKDKAKKIYEENKEDIFTRLKQGDDVQFVIWGDMVNNIDYSEEKFRIDRGVKLEDGKIPYIENREYLEFN